jgi:hypothetical protein
MDSSFIKRHYSEVIEEFARDKSISKDEAWILFFCLLSDNVFGWGESLKENLNRELEVQYSVDDEE